MTQYKQITPNLLTTCRVLLIPAVFILLYPFGSNSYLTIGSSHNHYYYQLSIRYLVAGLLFIVAACTDFLDGYFARKWQVTSTFGAFFDAIADKLLCNAIIIMMMVLQGLPIWLGTILILRDFYVDLLRQILGKKNITMAANIWGKTSTFIKLIGLTILFVIGPLQFPNLGLYHWVNQIVLIPMDFALVMSLIAAIIYTKQNYATLLSHPSKPL